jgi:hypothetical protein
VGDGPKRRRGELKRAVLEALGDGRWHRPRQIAAALPFARRGQLHAYLLRLCSSASAPVERARERNTMRYIYRLSDRGCRILLAWHFQEREREKNRS